MPSSPWRPDPYPSLAEHWQTRFGQRVHRVALDAGFSCPNRDGTLASSGCIFCDPVSFSPSAGDRRPVHLQLADGMNRLRRRGVGRFAAYFQPHTNTHAALSVLRRTWDQVLPFREVVALCVGTRPDCVPDPVLDLLAEYAGRFEVWLELGLQSAREETLRLLRRQHTAGDFSDACTRARARGLQVCAHVILGLPGEDAADESRTALFLSRLGVEGVKLHQLAVVRGTALEDMWIQGKFRTLAEDEYVERATAFVRELPDGTVLHRLVGDTAAERLVAPRYNKSRVIEAIRRRVKRGERFEARGSR